MSLIKNIKKATFWFSVAMIFGLAGLYIGFFALGLIGLSVSGSGCNDECHSRIRLIAAIGMFLLGISAPSAVYSVFLTWLQVGFTTKLWSDMLVIFVAFFIAVITSSSLALLILIFF